MSLHLIWLRAVPTRWRGENRPQSFDPLPLLPPELHPPEPLPDDENGYAALAKIVADWPAEGVHAPDLKHRLEALPGDRQAAERALLPLRPVLDRIPEALAYPRWQALTPENEPYVELAPIKRLVRALLLRGALENREADRAAAVEIATRLRRSEGPMITFLIGLSLGKEAGGLDANLEHEWREALRWDLARVTALQVAQATLPDEKPKGYEEPPAWEARRLAQAWILRDHPHPYDPKATLRALAEDHPTLTDHTAKPIESPWPSSFRSIIPGGLSIVGLLGARKAILAIDNPYGLSSRAHIAELAAQTHTAVEKATNKRTRSV